MLLNSRMASIPCSPRHSLIYMKDIEHLFKKQVRNSRLAFAPQPTASGLQYFNMRVTQRLRRYRSMKKHWQEVAISVQNTTVPPTCESPISQDTTKTLSVQIPKTTNEAKSYCINDYINSTTVVKDHHNNGKNSMESDPLHSRIQQDLIKLRKFIKAKQRKVIDNPSPQKTPTNSSQPSGEATSISTTFDDQENHNITIIRKASSINKLKPLDRVKIAGCQMRPPILSKSDSADSGIGSTSNASSTCSQYSKQQQQQPPQQKLKRNNNNSKTFNIYHSRVNPPPPPLPSDSLFYRSSYSSRKKFNTSSKMSQNTTPSKKFLPSRLSIPIPPVIEQKQSSFIKQETPLPPIRRSSHSDDMNAHLYTYAASTSSATPRSMMLKRNTSLLPILLQSSSCIGIQPRKINSKKIESDLEEEHDETITTTNNNNDDDDYYHLLNYNHLINRLPKPVISIYPRSGQDDYGVLFEQLDHIRETMPDSNIYDDYARITT